MWDRQKNKTCKKWNISDYSACLSTLKDEFAFKIVEYYSISEYETELKTKDLTLALYKFFLTIDKPYIQRVKLLIVDKKHPLFPIIVADKYVYQSY